MDAKKFGDFIAQARRERKLTQAQLAHRLHVTDKAVSRWERDESLPDLMLLPVIADLFHITVDELLRGERGWYLNGQSVCADCFPAFARAELAPCETVFGMEGEA